MAVIELELDARAIARSNNRTELLEFIKDLDAAMGEWDFTLDLCAYFESKGEEYEREQVEDAAKSGLAAKAGR